MAFKLGSERRNFGQRGKNHFDASDASIPGTKVVRKDLEGGVKGEANMDGSIFIDNSVEPGSQEERAILMHEMKHIVDMKTGKLAYDDDKITWMGEDYERKDGKINFKGEWLPEGSKDFPWEKH